LSAEVFNPFEVLNIDPGLGEDRHHPIQDFFTGRDGPKAGPGEVKVPTLDSLDFFSDRTVLIELETDDETVAFGV